MKKEQNIIFNIILGGFIIQLILLAIKVLKIVQWSWYIILLPIEIYIGLGIICGILLSIIIAFED